MFQEYMHAQKHGNTIFIFKKNSRHYIILIKSLPQKGQDSYGSLDMLFLDVAPHHSQKGHLKSFTLVCSTSDTETEVAGGSTLAGADG